MVTQIRVEPDGAQLCGRSLSPTGGCDFVSLVKPGFIWETFVWVCMRRNACALSARVCRYVCTSTRGKPVAILQEPDIYVKAQMCHQCMCVQRHVCTSASGQPSAILQELDPLHFEVWSIGSEAKQSPGLAGKLAMAAICFPNLPV